MEECMITSIEGLVDCICHCQNTLECVIIFLKYYPIYNQLHLYTRTVEYTFKHTVKFWWMTITWVIAWTTFCSVCSMWKVRIVCSVILFNSLTLLIALNVLFISAGITLDRVDICDQLSESPDTFDGLADMLEVEELIAKDTAVAVKAD